MIPVAVLVVAKAPVPGLAKTRLAASIGADAAADLAAAALLDTLDAVAAASVQASVVALTGDVEAAARENPGVPVPIDLVTTSASGFDPHLSPAAADFQVPRVARERGLTEADVRRLVTAHTTGRQLGFFGEATVNVLELNLALDQLAPRQNKQ